MLHGGMRSGLLHATRSLSSLAQIPKEGDQSLEHMYWASTMPQQGHTQAKNTRLGPDFYKNGCVPGGEECCMVGCVVGCCMLPEASLAWPRYLRKVTNHLNTCIGHPPCHNRAIPRLRTPGWALIFTKMGAFLAVKNAAWWDA